MTSILRPRVAFPGRWLSGWQAGDIAPLASLALLVVFFSVTSPGFLRPATLAAVLKQGSVLAIVSVGGGKR